MYVILFYTYCVLRTRQAEKLFGVGLTRISSKSHCPFLAFASTWAQDTHGFLIRSHKMADANRVDMLRRQSRILLRWQSACMQCCILQASAPISAMPRILQRLIPVADGQVRVIQFGSRLVDGMFCMHRALRSILDQAPAKSLSLVLAEI